MTTISQGIVRKKMVALVRAAVIEILEKEGFEMRRKEAFDVNGAADDLLELITPKKGVHYDDGEDGRDGIDGDDGEDGKDGEDGIDGQDAEEVDEDAIIKKVTDAVLSKIERPKDGKDADPDAIIHEVEKRLDKIFNKKFTIKDIEGLEDELIGVRSKKHGGQGKTYAVFVGTGLTTADSITFTFTQPPLESEMEVYRGGGRIFKENGDYTVTAFPGGRVKSITLAFVLANGENINIRTKG